MSVSVLTESARPTAARAWLPGFLLLAVIWGSSFLLIKVGIGELAPVYVALGRVAAGALTLLILLVAVRQRLPRDPRVWGHLAVAGTLGSALPFTLFAAGEQRIPSILAGIWNASTPLIVLPMAVLVFRTEAMTRRRAAGLVVGFAGVLIVLGVWQVGAGSSLIGQLLCLTAAACYGVAIPYQRRFLARRPESGIALAAGQLIVGTLALAVAAPLIAGPPPVPTTLAAPVIASVLALGALGTGLAFALNFRVIRLAGASTSASVTYLLPIVATLLGIAVLGEHLTWYQPVGVAVVLAGVAISQGVLAVRRRPAVPAPLAAACQQV